MNHISSNLKFLRKLSGLSQEQFAQKVGMNRGNIASYEKGNAEPSIEKLQRIVGFFEVDLVAFIENDLSHEMGMNNLNNKGHETAERLHSKTNTTSQLKIAQMEQTPSSLSVSNMQTHVHALMEFEFQFKQNLSKNMGGIEHKMDHLVKSMDTLVQLNKQLVEYFLKTKVSN